MMQNICIMTTKIASLIFVMNRIADDITARVLHGKPENVSYMRQCFDFHLLVEKIMKPGALMGKAI